jgi:voltage-gated potassium channel
MAPVPRGRGLRDPEFRDRLYDLLEHDPLAYSVGSRFIQLIIGVIVLNVAAMILASLPELYAQFGTL